MNRVTAKAVAAAYGEYFRGMGKGFKEAWKAMANLNGPQKIVSSSVGLVLASPVMYGAYAARQESIRDQECSDKRRTELCRKEALKFFEVYKGKPMDEYAKDLLGDCRRLCPDLNLPPCT